MVFECVYFWNECGFGWCVVGGIWVVEGVHNYGMWICVVGVVWVVTGV